MAKIARMPKCGAKTRSGEPCRAPPMANGRCRRHGGSTPSGAGWHKIKLPARGEKRGVEKFEAKVARKARRDSEKFQRLALMTPEQRAAHERWQQSHVPGSKSGRAHRRQQKETFSWLNKMAVDREKLAASEQDTSTEDLDIFA